MAELEKNGKGDQNDQKQEIVSDHGMTRLASFCQETETEVGEVRGL